MLDFDDLLSRVPEKDVARLLGNKTTRYVRSLAEDGDLIRVAPGIYNLGASLPALTAKRAAKVTDERVRLAKEQADGHALKNAQLRGELVPASQMETVMSRDYAAVRAGVLSVVPRIQQLIPGMSVVEVSIFDRELRQVLQVLGEDRDGHSGSAETPVAPPPDPATEA